MARENLPTNYVNYELATAMGGMRRFNQINNSDGTISFEDATTYSTTGTTYGANEINTANALINEINELVGTTSISGSGQTDITSLLGGTDITNATLGIGDGTVTGAISEINSNLTDLNTISSGVTVSLSGSSSTGTLTYYRIGKIVLVNGRIYASSSTSAVSGAFSGLPTPTQELYIPTSGGIGKFVDLRSDGGLRNYSESGSGTVSYFSFCYFSND